MFSIIVPVYNSSSTIVACLNSIKAQIFEDFEVIVVSDGSSDSTDDLCRECIGEDSRFLFIHRNHEGVSSTRQYALNLSQKEWVVFLDADDTMPEDSLLKMAEVINSGIQVDLIAGNYTAVSGQTKQYIDLSFNSQYEYIREFLSFGIVPTTVWGKAIRISLIKQNNISFNTNIDICEDYLFLSKVLLKSQYIRFIRSSLYNWTANSTTGLSNSKMYDFHTKSEVLLETLKYYSDHQATKYLTAVNRAMFVTYMMFIASKYYSHPNLTQPVFSIKDIHYTGLTIIEKVMLFLTRNRFYRLAIYLFMNRA